MKTNTFAYIQSPVVHTGIFGIPVYSKYTATETDPCRLKNWPPPPPED